MIKMQKKIYKIIGAYDSETSTICEQGEYKSFPILHQLGLLKEDINRINSKNVIEETEIFLYRTCIDLYHKLDELVNTEFGYVPVILCHNLAFDMWGLSPWLDRYEVKVLAKSAKKPITFTILDDEDNPRLVIWDTLIFSQQPLERMGKDCGFKKAVGDWDYEKVRTPQTPLSEEEIRYSKNDIYALLAWFGWWIKHNPDIDYSKLGRNVVTKTGIVREKRKERFNKIKGRGMHNHVGKFWYFTCNSEIAKTDDELFTNLACTRGGFTFCSSKNASIPFNLRNTKYTIAAFDATSQHPAQMVSHFYPVNFRKTTPDVLDADFTVIENTDINYILENWDKPFSIAFNACFEFTNIRPKKGSTFKKEGIFPLTSARFKHYSKFEEVENQGDRKAYLLNLEENEYKDVAINPMFAFGKLISAEIAKVFITELTAWEICQCYEWDSVKAVSGYETGNYSKPTDLDLISVMQFYKAKNEFKVARETFYKEHTIHNYDNLINLGVPQSVAYEMKNNTISSGDVEAVYLNLKADINALFGINASNEFRRDVVLTSEGIQYEGEFGICNAPKNSKVWYQFGQRIVGWSRIAQICAIYLVKDYSKAIINGDTDSIKILIKEKDLSKASKSLMRLGKAIDKGKEKTCARIKEHYSEYYDNLEGIGYYIQEFTTKRFCASWNKAYCEQDNKDKFSFTLAGVPTRKRENDKCSFIGINGYADRLYKNGWSFEKICNYLLGYNITYAYDVLLMNARTFPEWGDIFHEEIVDYLGKKTIVTEPFALSLHPMSKTINDTSVSENAVNMQYAIKNNPDVNTKKQLIFSKGVMNLEEIL